MASLQDTHDLLLTMIERGGLKPVDAERIQACADVVAQAIERETKSLDMATRCAAYETLLREAAALAPSMTEAEITKWDSIWRAKVEAALKP